MSSRIFAPSWILVFLSSWIVVSSWIFVSFVDLRASQRSLPPGAVSVINEARSGSLVAYCFATSSPDVQRGPRKIPMTEVWVGREGSLRRLDAGLGACDPAFSPDGRRVAVVAEDGLWVFPASPGEGSLRVEAKIPMGERTEFTYRAFAHPAWSPDGGLVALLVSNGGTSWVEVFHATNGRLFYTSPPEIYTVSWGRNARELKAGTESIRLPPYR